MQKHGCKKCSIKKNINKRKLGKNKFVQKAKILHEDKYIYDKVIYENSHRHVIVICPEHGEFPVTPTNHLSLKKGCQMCSGRKSSAGYKNFSSRISQEEFIRRAITHCNSNSTFSKSFIKLIIKVTVICQQHGEFKILPSNWQGGVV